MGAASAILFPGQGSQTPDMRDLVQRVRPDLLEMAVQAVGEDPFPRADEGTHYAQPAIFCASLAGWEAIGRPVEAFMAGHSLGELGALVAAGALEEREGLELVALRGRLMHQSGLEAADGEGGMIAVLGAGASDHASDIAEAHGLTVANDNSPVQVVISGAKSRLPEALAHAKELGLRAMELDVTGAFHSPMMAGAVPEFERALAGTAFGEPAEGTTVISAVTAAALHRPAPRARRRAHHAGALARSDADAPGAGRRALHRRGTRPRPHRPGQAHAVRGGARQCLSRPCSPRARRRQRPVGVSRTPRSSRSPPTCRPTVSPAPSWPGSWASPRSGSSAAPGSASAAAPGPTSGSAITPPAPAPVPWRPQGWMRRILIS